MLRMDDADSIYGKAFYPLEREEGKGIVMWKVVNSEEVAYSPYKTGVANIRRVLGEGELKGLKFSGFGFLQIPPGGEFKVHVHPEREEIYHVLSGSGTIRVETETVEASPGITVHISGETAHGIENSTDQTLTIIYVTAWA